MSLFPEATQPLLPSHSRTILAAVSETAPIAEMGLCFSQEPHGQSGQEAKVGEHLSPKSAGATLQLRRDQ